MLLQSHDDVIKLIPALPEKWNTGHADGLCARGGFTVDQEWKNGALVSATILSKNGNVCNVSYQGQKISFPTEKGKSYTILPDMSVVEQDSLRNVARGKTVTSSGDAASGAAKNAVDGSASSAWVSDSKDASWIQVDLGKEYDIYRWDMQLAGVSGEYLGDARSIAVSFSKDGKTWTETKVINGNTKNICGSNIAPTSARYVKAEINIPAQKDGGTAKINELEVWGISDEPEPTRSPFETVEAESFDRQYGIETEALDDGGMDVGFIQDGDYIMFRRMNFGAGADGFAIKAGSETDGGTISLRLDSPSGKEIGSCKITGTDGWTTFKEFTCDVTGAAGIHDLYLVFEGDDGFLMNIDSFKFTTSKAAGDVDGDGKCAAADAVALQKHLLTQKALTAAQAAAADLNGDGKLTSADLTLLKRLLLK